jgi:glycerol-3-phosphate dehydrogenase
MEALFSGLERKEILQEMNGQSYDLLVIGGGITGAGIALDAQSRGIRTALVEMQDFAAGTSSRSTKLVHGGLRYLKQLEVKMVAEVGKDHTGVDAAALL